jgi:hypothetical protein
VNSIFHISIRINCNPINEGLLCSVASGGSHVSPSLLSQTATISLCVKVRRICVCHIVFVSRCFDLVMPPYRRMCWGPTARANWFCYVEHILFDSPFLKERIRWLDASARHWLTWGSLLWHGWMKYAETHLTQKWTFGRKMKGFRQLIYESEDWHTYGCW